jgi:hypothetical protein
VILKVADGQSLSSIARELMPGRQRVRKWAERFIRQRPGTAAAKPRVVGLQDDPRSGRRFPPPGTAEGVALGGRARTLRQDGLVESISLQTVQRILQSRQLKPWRVHHWLSPKTPRDEEFRLQVQGGPRAVHSAAGGLRAGSVG